MTTQANPITIRVAAALEAANIVRTLKNHWSEQGGLRPERVNDMRALIHVMEIIDRGRVVVADRAGRLIGVAGVIARAEPWSDDWYMDLQWLYAVPFNTKVTAGDMTHSEASALRRETEESLLAAVEQFADERQLPLVNQTFYLNSENHDQIFSDRRYLRLGGVHMRMPGEVANVPLSRTG